MSYADENTVKSLTKGLDQDIDDQNVDSTLLALALEHADNKINRKLRKNDIEITETAPPGYEEAFEDLIEAANLYATVFLNDAYNTSNDARSPTSVAWENDADDSLQSYIDTILKGLTDDPDDDKPMPQFGVLI